MPVRLVAKGQDKITNLLSPPSSDYSLPFRLWFEAKLRQYEKYNFGPKSFEANKKHTSLSIDGKPRWVVERKSGSGKTIFIGINPEDKNLNKPLEGFFAYLDEAKIRYKVNNRSCALTFFISPFGISEALLTEMLEKLQELNIDYSLVYDYESYPSGKAYLNRIGMEPNILFIDPQSRLKRLAIAIHSKNRGKVSNFWKTRAGQNKLTLSDSYEGFSFSGKFVRLKELKSELNGIERECKLSGVAGPRLFTAKAARALLFSELSSVDNNFFKNFSPIPIDRYRKTYNDLSGGSFNELPKGFKVITRKIRSDDFQQ